MLEHDTVWNMLADRKLNGSNHRRQPAMRIDVIGVSRLFDPPWIDARQFFTSDNRLGKRPLLIGIEHDHYVGAGQVTKELTAMSVSFERAPHFELERPEALTKTPLHIFANPGIVVVIPANAGIVARISARDHIVPTL